MDSDVQPMLKIIFFTVAKSMLQKVFDLLRTTLMPPIVKADERRELQHTNVSDPNGLPADDT